MRQVGDEARLLRVKILEQDTHSLIPQTLISPTMCHELLWVIRM